MSGERRHRVVAMLMALALLACTGRDDPPVSDNSKAPVPELRVERIVAEGDRPSGDSVVVFGVQLLGLHNENGNTPHLNRLVMSSDRGRSWVAVDLPGAPSDLALSRRPDNFSIGNGVAVLAGSDASSASDVYPAAQPGFYLWTSRDAASWQVHEFETDGALTGSPEVTRVGETLLASADSTGGQNLYTSSDNGRSWRRGRITGAKPVGTDVERVWAVDGEYRIVLGSRSSTSATRFLLTSRDRGRTWVGDTCDLRCRDRVEAGRLRSRGSTISLDGGRTWSPINVSPAPPDGSSNPPGIVTLNALPDGWLATASSFEPSEISYGQLLRSEDGRKWRQTLPTDPCMRLGGTRPNSSLSTPTKVNDTWFVAYSCASLSTAIVSMLYAGDASATGFEFVGKTRRSDVAYAEPVVSGELLLVPEVGEDGVLSAMTVVS